MNTNQSYIREANFFKFYLKELFLKIGFVGTSGLYLSLFCYKKERKIFYFLILLIIFVILIASSPIFILWTLFPDILSLPIGFYEKMMYFFNRLWCYSIIPLSALSSIGLISLGYKLKKLKIKIFKNLCLNFRKEKNFFLFKNISLSLIIFFSFSNLIITGMWMFNTNKIDDSEANIVGWVSENIPANSNIIVDSWGFYRTLFFMGDSHEFFVNQIYEEAMKNTENFWDTKWHYDYNCNIILLDELDGHNRSLKFEDHNNYGNAELQTSLEIPQTNGTLTFWIRLNETEDKKCFNLYLLGNGGYLINLQIINNKIYYFIDNNTEIYELQEHTWYNISIDFECTDGGYNGLNQFNWRLMINDSIYNNLSFRNKSTQLDEICLLTNYYHSDFSFFIDDLRFSWDSDYNIENSFPREIFFNYLIQKDIKYLITTQKNTNYKSGLAPLFYEMELIPYFFKEKLYEYKGVKVYYAPRI